MKVSGHTPEGPDSPSVVQHRRPHHRCAKENWNW